MHVLNLVSPALATASGTDNKMGLRLIFKPRCQTTIMKRIHVQIAAWCLCAIAIPGSAIADCDRPRSALTALKQADVVLRGTVREISTTGGRGEPIVAPRGTEYQPGWTGWVVTFDVSRVWKGTVGDRFILRSVLVGPDDAFTEFDRGAEYLVFARRNSDRDSARFGVAGPTFGAHLCGGTTSLLWATKYLLDLGIGKGPEASRR